MLTSKFNFINFICTFGIPNIILTYQGTNLVGTLMEDIAKLFKIKIKIQTTAYRPQSNGVLQNITKHHCTGVTFNAVKRYIAKI